MGNREEKIQVRAYEIWERENYPGYPEEHWLKAEREIRAEESSADASRDRSGATMEEAPSAEAATSSPAQNERSS